MEKDTGKKEVYSFTPSKEEKAVYLSREAARAAQTADVARQQGDAAAGERLQASAAKKSQDALKQLKG